MKYIAKYGLHVPDDIYREWKKKHKWMTSEHFAQDYLQVTEHGTICRKDLVEELEQANKRKKNKDYSKGLQVNPTKHMRRKFKQLARYNEMKELSDKISNNKATSKEANRFKVLMLLERGRHNLKKMRRF